MAYAPFGEGYTTVSDEYVQFTSAGNEWTVADGNNLTGSLVDFMYRRYNPTQGRWISPDPAGLGAVNPANPQTWNRYGYVANNPLLLTDPSGLGGPKCPINPITGTCFRVYPTGADPSVGTCMVSIDGGGNVPCELAFGSALSTLSGTFNMNSSQILGASGGYWSVVNSGIVGGPLQTAFTFYPANANAANNYVPFSLYPPSMFAPQNNMAVVSQWRPPKPDHYFTGPPVPYKPSVVDCMTGPNDAVDRMTENAPPIEHDPSAGGWFGSLGTGDLIRLLRPKLQREQTL